jgi:hypothetical protein
VAALTGKAFANFKLRRIDHVIADTTRALAIAPDDPNALLIRAALGEHAIGRLRLKA